MMGGELTASQIASHERSKAFKAKIAGRAAQLAYASSPEVLLRALPPEACAAETDPPRLVIEAAPPPVPSTPRAKFWFHIDEQRGHPSIARIQEAVCDQFSVTLNDLQ